VFNLEECISKEFLRPRENRCKWFNAFGVMRRRLFIRRGDKTKFSHKNNRLNRFTKCLNRFRQQKDRQEKYEGWYNSRYIWVDSSVPRWRLNDSNFVWINSMQVRKFCETIQAKKKRCVYESIQIDVNRFTWSRKLYWIDSDCDESIHFDSKRILTLFQTAQNIKIKLYRL